MESPGAAGRRRGNSRSNVEDQALDQIAKEVSSALNHLISTQTYRHISYSYTIHLSTKSN